MCAYGIFHLLMTIFCYWAGYWARQGKTNKIKIYFISGVKMGDNLYTLLSRHFCYNYAINNAAKDLIFKCFFV